MFLICSGVVSRDGWDIPPAQAPSVIQRLRAVCHLPRYAGEESEGAYQILTVSRRSLTANLYGLTYRWGARNPLP